MARSTAQVNLGGRCAPGCTPCDCHDSPATLDAQGLAPGLRGGGERLEFRGDAPTMPTFARALAAARSQGWREVVVRTHGATIATPEGASALRDAGVDGVVVPLFSHATPVHDRVAGHAGALVTALRAMRAASAAGLKVGVEIPLLSVRLQSLPALVELAHRAVPSLSSARFYVPVRPQPAVLAPPAWTEARGPLGEALAWCDAHGVATGFHEFDAVPFCALAHEEAHQRRFRFDPRRPAARRSGFGLEAPCESCAMRSHCAGPSDAYRAAHGGDGLVAFTVKPRRLLDQRTTPKREWQAHQREAASMVINRVLRPTVHCNQDCPFCSANETTENVFPDAGEMLRRIARLARAGVKYISFSGGEPTLSKDLVHYLRAASRLGIRDIELVTNGALIDSPAKVRPLVEAGLSKAFVSLHAHDELLARRTTSKVGDWERSVRAIHAMLDAGVRVDLNHVISSINYAYLPRFADFVTDTFQGRVGVSFAFITPQFKALENRSLVPRISDVMPYLRAAMRRFAERRNAFVIGSRQGIPPCFLGEFTAWSDFVEMSPQAHADDEPQKIRGPACDTCRFSPQCVGLWKPYAAMYGFDELRPVPGAPLTADEARTIAAERAPLDFSEVHPALRMAPTPPETLAPPPEPPREPRRLAVLREAPARTLRAVLLGSGPQAERLARAVSQVPGLSLVGVASPHLLDRDPGPFAGLTLDRDAGALLDALRPDVALVAAATVAHLSLTEACVARGVAALVEKPLARTPAEADALVTLSASGFVMPAHAALFSPGVLALRAQLAGGFGKVLRAALTKRVTPASSDAPATWGREGIYQTLYHAVYTLGAAAGGGEGAVLDATARGAHRPESVRVELSYAGGVKATLTLDCEAAAASDELTVTGERGRRVTWRRDGAGEVIVHDSPSGDRTTSVERGHDGALMLAALRDAVLTGAAPPVTADEGRAAMRTALAVTEALREFWSRPTAPKHVASPAMRG